MKVALVCPYDLNRPGGVQQQVLELWRLLEKNRTDVVLVGPGAGVYGGLDVGVVLPVRANGSVVPLAVGLGVRRRLQTALSTADVVHVHEPLMPVVGMAALRVGRPVVATFHARPPRWALTIGRLIPRTWFQSTVLTAVSPEATHLASRLGDVQIVPIGIHCADYLLNETRRADRIVFLGRDEPRKGLRVLLKAWPLIRSQHPMAELVIIGSSGDDHKARGVEYVGRVSQEEKRKLLCSASVMVAPNLGGESFGLVVLEAMAAGCAVVASDIPAFRYVTAGAGLLFPVGDEHGLAASVSALLDNPAQVERRSSASWLRAADFDWSRVLPQYERCYQLAVAGARRGVG